MVTRMTPAAVRPVLAGNSLAGCHVLDLLLQSYPADDVLVIAPPAGTAPDWRPSLAARASEHGVEVIEPERVNDPWVIDRLTTHRADLLLSVYYTQIFHPALLAAVTGPALNFHPALLPRHRGTAPLIWAIAEGDEVTGVTVHDLTEGVDTGPTRYVAPIPIHPDDTGYSLHVKVATLVHALAADILRRVRAGTALPPPVEQRGEATHHSLRDPHLNHIDARWDAERVRNVARALAPPLPGAYVEVGGERLVLSALQVSTPMSARAGSTPGLLDVPDAVGPVRLWAADRSLVIDEAVWQGVTLRAAELARHLLPYSGTIVQ